ncbi:MRPL23 (YOR150W) [Zygosaccharomyces parabailii]|uniref:Large ribosomal subunit protein uL13m n=1 Tax=Zygosaccharomyces bailii (strain CLIB 213 / ATCC 58445 / CBS 680 / BCRC 21525 / NBRC 1098 / NCYC 1416 / NRRL Y-2227) TaxID=1333698 RepID=A0A8J2T858_ZYGB2|nr:MRPL23 (YOR150W) [Zygosaccharomyces parabailii]CDF89911.1 ZYBA0S05-04588g1_1 [Zygosaccharomyces bailii CLIB 213]CDH17669.1 probable 54S ribosomal protein L23,mitochondrial [Zygosaccharomyces bailii ISA1307]SJM88690.1 probable 54S ribosomal protein L23, mitochondrial [Zygosaccharomyces bailii]
MSQKLGHSGLAFARLWHHVDVAQDKRTLGRLASAIAMTLIGKHKPVYHQSQDSGDYVVVTNCQALRVTGKKLQQKHYWSHSGKPGHLKLTPMEKVIADKGYGETLKRAVSGMLPKNKLREVRLQRLKVFDGSEHPYAHNISALSLKKAQPEGESK